MSNSARKGNSKINIAGLNIECDKPYMVMGEPIKSGEEVHQLGITISDVVKSHSRMCHTTDINTMKLIFENMTFRSSSLLNSNLNDKMEKQRVGILQFAGGRFITCFSHLNHESIPLWFLYGGKEKSNKVQLQFKNFARSFKDSIFTDYCLINGEKKVFFNSSEYTNTVNRNCVVGQRSGLPQINTDYDTRNFVRNITMFDVEYIPTDSTVFTDDYSGTSSVDFGNLADNNENENTVLSDVKIFRTDCLGKQKSNPWSYEYETRIMIVLDNQEFSKWDYIDLRLKETLFKDLIVIMNPWVEDNFEQQIRDIINSSSLSDDIKKSIQIVESVVTGTLNL